MFENNFEKVARKFKHLITMYFTDISKNFIRALHQIAVTNTDGSEYHNRVSLRLEQKRKYNIW